ncbi:MAG: uL22 family ribosomal protein [archaeon]
MEDKKIKPEVKAEKPAEIKKEVVSEQPVKKDEAKQKKKLHEAVVNAKDSPVSLKHSIAICRMIKGKQIGKAQEILQKVARVEVAVPMYGDEIPHRKGMMSGRYPVKASEQFIKLLKNLAANAAVNGLDISRTMISIAKADTAARRRYHRKFKRFKRTHISLIAKEVLGK